MATFNGERYLGELLQSLAEQTRRPDRLIVYDDCSRDATVQLLEQFSRSSPFPMAIIRGREQVGYADAFVEAARRCESDLVALCDQDDVWKHGKLDRCAREFDSVPAIALLAHSWEVPTWFGTRRAGYRRYAVTGPSRTPWVWPPGFATVIPRRTIDVAESIRTRPLRELGWGHDDWFTFVATALGRVVFLPDRLVTYRQHDANVLGAARERLRERVGRSVGEHGGEEAIYRGIASWARHQREVLQTLSGMAGEWGYDPSGPLDRVPLFQRAAETNERRSALYDEAKRQGSRYRLLLSHLLRGDYGRKNRAGLGAASLARDALYTLGLLGVLAGGGGG